jgi:riboflavin kinase/FMN adenylyltransferase
MEKLPAFNRPVITTGMFDGIHCGHAELLRRIRQLSDQQNSESVLITFQPHPRQVLFPNEPPLKILSTLAEKSERLAAFGIHHFVVIPFTIELSMLPARTYVKDFLARNFNPSVIVEGYNHHFGHHRDGNIELLRKMSAKLNYKVEEIPRHIVDEMEVSSSRIRIALSEGDVQLAAQLLGYEYSISGSVVKGEQIGRSLGFPTANIQPEDGQKLIPADGIYFVRATVGSKLHPALCSIGYRPTLGGKARTIEVYLLDFSNDLYGASLRINFLKFHRNEIQFPSLADLQSAMRDDETTARKFFGC